MSKARKSRARRFFNIILFVVLVTLVALMLQRFVFFSSYVDGSSMQPTLNGGVENVVKDGDKLLVVKLGKITRGDIIVLRPEGNTYDVVKRVIAVAGDFVEIKDGVLYLNDQPQTESYIKEPMTIPDMEKTLVPAESIFVLGDNRNHSLDSSEYGPVSLDVVKGKVFAVYSVNNKRLELI